MELETAFREGFAAAAERSATLGATDLGARLAELVSLGRNAHPGLALDGPSFARHLGRCAARTEVTSIEALQALAIDDLYLACACFLGVSGAVAGFDVRCGRRMRMAVSGAIKSEELRREIEQQAHDVLLVGGVDAPARIADYRGQGPLDRWVAVVTHGLAITLLRAEGAEQRAREGAAREPTSADVPLELAYAQHRYRSEFEAALADAISVLPPRDRVLLRLQLVRGVSVEAIGKMYDVSQSTASRWLAQARDLISTELRRLLAERLHLSPDDVSSLAGLVASQMDLSMSRLLKTG